MINGRTYIERSNYIGAWMTVAKSDCHHPFVLVPIRKEVKEVMKEQKIKVVVKLLFESKKNLSELRSSAGPVASESLEKLQHFLKDFEKEVVHVSQDKSLMKKVILISLGLLMAIDRLLTELVPQAINVINQLFLK